MTGMCARYILEWMFNLIFFCQSIDSHDPIIADTKGRVITFSELPEVRHAWLITTRGKEILAHKKISHLNLDIPSNGRIMTLMWLYWAIVKLIPNGKLLFYCYMTPTIPFWISPFKIFRNFKIATWFAHSNFNALVKFNLKYLSDLWFAPNLGHASLKYKNLKIVGQAVDSDLFRPQKADKKFDLITVGRLTPVKKIENILDAVFVLKNKYNLSLSLCICGDAYSKDDFLYKEKLISIVSKLKLNEQIHFQNTVLKENLPNFLKQSKLFVFPQRGGISKAVVEALSMGLPIIITEDSTDYLGERLNSLFISGVLPEDLALKIKYFVELDLMAYEKISLDCSELIAKNGTQKDLFQRISNEICKVFY